MLRLLESQMKLERKNRDKVRNKLSLRIYYAINIQVFSRSNI